ncbi:hypothetical protein PENANT_c014G11308 [Penicillium antarcticum]|uniref:Phosphatidate phosphatase APP1 catalytic domain-containing protein n=1 Tax=Penicillium antarcticum TaxID=416450 RepID=A0A1V6Q4Y9_9EURO|nr:uncharacterized protein N7508_009594 [Penicillium antarcticum]KAJ5294773.1 hypothetical protein N7508_009594 [Penicillium antarcticum]OQD84077.1 hypothetical protein PENANT_c014G11308 [Penicillium antarcticum]
MAHDQDLSVAYSHHHGHSRKDSHEHEHTSQHSSPSSSSSSSPDRPTPERRSSTIINYLSSFLGSKNPLSQPANPKKNTVWLFDNTAYQVKTYNKHNELVSRTWEAEVVACIFEKGHRKDAGKFIAAIADYIGLDGELGGTHEAEVRRRIEDRVQPFLDPVSPSRMVSLHVPISRRGQVHDLGPSDRNGIVSQNICIGEVGGIHHIHDGTVIKPRLYDFAGEKVAMNTTFARAHGWLVISDIDDTVKRTMTLEPTGIIRSTFVEEAEVIAGMPEFYRWVDRELGAPGWFYLSASPYNLYPFLRAFLREHYCPGTLVLRDYSWMDITGLIRSFTEKTQEYKVDRMEKIQGWFPRRRVLCIGDSTQKDPEAYAEMYERHPRWIQAIAIRKVTDVAHMGEKNDRERFEKAFENVPDHVWTVFEDPRELYEFVDGLGMEEQEF